jgi:phospholipid/cholesterol/gamma-HCH transport system substrate-binding protein
MSREVRVGLLTIVALLVAATGVFMVGERRNLFSRKNVYFVRFENVVGLTSGNPVQLSGVTVGQVQDVVLPEDVDEKLLTVWLSVDRRFASRVRGDSEAKIKTLGLLGDKFVEISSGSPSSVEIPDGGEVQTAAATDVDKLIASGEDMVENVVAIAVSLRTILDNMEEGRGILGQLLTDDEAVASAKDSVVKSLGSLSRILDRVERGEGTLGTLINDNSLSARLNSSVDRIEAILGQVESGDGVLPALLNDPATRDRVEGLLTKLETAADGLGEFATDLNEGGGLFSRLMTDEEYGTEVSNNLRELIRNLNLVSAKLESGDGTVAQLINDPDLYQALDDIVLGIDESKLLRWTIRKKQKAGYKSRVSDEIEAETAAEEAAQEDGN